MHRVMWSDRHLLTTAKHETFTRQMASFTRQAFTLDEWASRLARSLHSNFPTLAKCQ